MLKLEPNKMQKAIERAKTIRPRVTVISAAERTYSITGSKGKTYNVRFVIVNCLRLAECNCKAGQRDKMSFHVAGASQVNVMVQSMRQQGASAPAATLAPRIVRCNERGHKGAKVVAVYCDGWSV